MTSEKMLLEEIVQRLGLIAHLRMEKVAEIATWCGVSKSHMYKILRGNSVPTEKLVRRWAEKYGIVIEDAGYVVYRNGTSRRAEADKD